MRFKTKDLMINVHPGDWQAEACYPTWQEQEMVYCHRYTPPVCPWFTRPCHWGTPCMRPTPFCGNHTPWVACEHGSKPELCGGASPYVEIDDITKYIREYTPVLEREPEQLEFLKQELATTMEVLAKIEPQAGLDRLAEVKKVEAGLVEALAQVRAQKKALAPKRATRKK